ncbi:MAG: RluA family pseudouridine synthase [Trichlorobacter sp.]|jgi:23S rRNA pseudouridine1911/1915/1917 synthase|nr:RluA family pseudouridine synthase [Trichlorobacter sp.]
MQQYTFTVTMDAAEQRLDLFLSSQLAEQSRSALQRLVEAGQVLVDGKTVRPSHKLKGFETILVTILPPVAATPLAEQIPLDIVYEDADLIVINKPAGMTVHPGAGVTSGTLVNALLGHCNDLSGIGGEIRPGIVHRLDKGTSGLLVAAKNDPAHRALATQFAEHKTKRIYQALVYGSPATETGKISNNIGRHPTDRLRYSGNAKQGKQATTSWRILERFGVASLVQLRLETGRTHQIRVHLTEAGMPLLGDPLYPDGGRFNNLKDAQLKSMIRNLDHQALHARVLGFVHPTNNQFMEFNSELPEDFTKILEYLREVYTV